MSSRSPVRSTVAGPGTMPSPSRTISDRFAVRGSLRLGQASTPWSSDPEGIDACSRSARSSSKWRGLDLYLQRFGGRDHAEPPGRPRQRRALQHGEHDDDDEHDVEQPGRAGHLVLSGWSPARSAPRRAVPPRTGTPVPARRRPCRTWATWWMPGLSALPVRHGMPALRELPALRLPTRERCALLAVSSAVGKEAAARGASSSATASATTPATVPSPPRRPPDGRGKPRWRQPPAPAR